MQAVGHSAWAATIVPVPKQDDSIRICGTTNKLTVNQVLDVDKYPLSKRNELFACFARGKKFIKSDMSHAYNQLMLDSNSSNFVTINTHKSLFRFTRLPFGVASPSAIIQKTMDQLLQGLPRIICYIHDILIAGQTDEEYWRNVRAVLQRLQNNGIHITKEKCSFIQESVTYLGCCVSAKGLSPTKVKMKAIAEVPSANNVQPLCSFLGLMNYYGRFIPNLSNML